MANQEERKTTHKDAQADEKKHAKGEHAEKGDLRRDEQHHHQGPTRPGRSQNDRSGSDSNSESGN